MRRAAVRLGLVWALLLAMTLIVYEGLAGGQQVHVFYVILIALALAKALIIITEYMEIGKISPRWIWFYVMLFFVVLAAFSVLHHLSASVA